MIGTYKIITYGCQMNVHESEKIAGLLENAGYELYEREDFFADVIVLNTCCVRENAETRVLGNLGILKKAKEKKPDLKIIVCGCMTQADGAAERLKARCPFIYAILGTTNIDEIPVLLSESHKKLNVKISQKFEIKEDIPIARTSGVNAWLNIMYGCNNFCSYCIVPYVRGRERSRDKNRIIADVKKLVGDGYKQITLLGQNVNSYGCDLGGNADDFPSLLKDLSAIDGEFRIKFMTSHPKDITEDTVNAIAESDKISRFIHVPPQSGSDRVLNLMNRKYTVSQYIDKIDMIRNKIPNAGLSGDMMVGFPTETDSDFAETLKLTEQVKYNNLYTFIYSARKGTPAAVMENQVSEADKKRRIAELIDLQFSIGNDLASECVGNTYRVLCTEFSVGRLIGETDCGKAVMLNGDDSCVGRFVTAKIVKNKNSKLYGEIV